jgi:translation initiation factor IF-2
MQTIATMAKRLGMNVDEALAALQKIGYEVNGVETMISDEQVDLLIEFDEDPSVIDRRLAKKADEERKKAEKTDRLLKANAKRREEAAAKKKAAVEKPKTAKSKGKTEEPATPHPVVEHLDGKGRPVAEILPPEKHEAPKPAAQIIREKAEPAKPAAPAIVIGSAIEHADKAVEIVRADGSIVDVPELEQLASIQTPVLAEAAEEDESVLGPLAEAERKQEEDERRKAKQTVKAPSPKPDAAVVAEVKRKAAERNLRMLQQRGMGAGSPTGKTARKKQKKQEKLRFEDGMRRDAAAAVREYEAGGMSAGGPKKRKRKRLREDGEIDGTLEEGLEVEILEVQEGMTIEELATAMEATVNDLILELMDHNVLATKNQQLSIELIRQLAESHGFEVRAVIPEEDEALAEEPDDPASLVHRAPVITVMGHVDHGKTSFLDVVRSANVAAGEAGGITQHIAAYDVPIGAKRVVFLDTPGHEAFTQMRSRGAQVTDIVVLVVAADDGVMPQTIEAIDHARAAEVPIVVAINKIDKPNAQPERIRQELTKYELVDEAWGGKTIMKNISAKTKEGVSELMELLVLESELLELKANPAKRARGAIIESEISRGQGPVAWVLVQAGTLKTGDVFLAGESYGRVRNMINSRGEHLTEAGPSTPVVVTGFTSLPAAGDKFNVLTDERIARAIAEKRAQRSKMKLIQPIRHVTLEDFHSQLLAGEKTQLNIIIKADVQGSVDVLESSLGKLGNEEVKVTIVHSGVGGVNESDVLLASASDAVIIGFYVTANTKAQKLAETEGVEIRSYKVIYEAIEAVRLALEGMLRPESREVVLGHLDVRQLFRSSAIGTIAGCHVTDGEVFNSSLIRVLRDDAIVFEGKIKTLRREKDDARSVRQGFDCGLKVDNFEDVKVGDVLEAYRVEEVAKTLA